MAVAYDFKQTEDGSLFIDPISMDFVITMSDPQHIKDLMLGVPGWTKEFEFAGFNPYSKINSRANKQANIRNATSTLIGDGFVKGPGGIDFELTPNGEFDIKIIDVFRP